MLQLAILVLTDHARKNKIVRRLEGQCVKKNAICLAWLYFLVLFSHQRNRLPQVCLPTKIQALKAPQASLPRKKNLKTSKINTYYALSSLRRRNLKKEVLLWKRIKCSQGLSSSSPPGAREGESGRSVMLWVRPKVNTADFLIREEPSLMFSIVKEARDQRVPGSNRRNKAAFSNSFCEMWMSPYVHCVEKKNKM